MKVSALAAGEPIGQSKVLAEALKTAADYTALTIAETLKNPENPWYGVDFETTLPALHGMLTESMKKQNV